MSVSMVTWSCCRRDECVFVCSEGCRLIYFDFELLKDSCLAYHAVCQVH